MSISSTERKEEGGMALTTSSPEGASQKRFNIILAFDLNEFDSNKLTVQYVRRVLQTRIGGPGVSITVQEVEA